VLFRELVDTSRQVAETRARLGKIELLARTFARLAPEEIALGVAFLSGETGRGKVGVGWSGLRAASAEAAAAPTLSLADVARALGEIEAARGAGSGATRARLLGELFARATAPEQDFLRRLLLGELRQGAQEGVIVDAIARAAGIDAGKVRRAVMLSGDPSAVAVAALPGDVSGLARFSLELFRPLQPMLAQTAEDARDGFARAAVVAVEDKLDGARVQVHRDGDLVRVFSRRLNDVTDAVPEVVDAVRRLPLRQVVLDGEALALDPAGVPLPFQTTMRRFGRRRDVDRLRAELPLSAFFFDCLHLDGADLIDLPTEERWRALTTALPPAETVTRALADSPAAVAELAHAALARGHEGVMLKSLDAPYEAGRRGGSWLKLKTAHTLDLVVLAAEWGSGRRTGWLSNLHLGARDQENGSFVMLGKTFKGMTDEMLRWQTARLLELELGREGHVVHVRPELVVEIAFDGVQTSPHYPGGLALRFARVKRYRQDKSAADADTIDAVRALHARSAEEFDPGRTGSGPLPEK
jgi:DNA ligase-1